MLTAALMLPAAAALADPNEDPGDIPSLRKKLNAATTDYNNAKGRLDKSRKKQKKLDKEIKGLEKKVDDLAGRVGEMAAAVYKGSRAGTVTVLLESASPQDVAHGMTTIEFLAHRDNKHIKAFNSSRDDLANKRYQVQLELRKQRVSLKKMAKKKKDALKALIAAGGGDPTGGPDGGAATADPSPRAPDGSWPPQGCTQNDPTTDGCLTPRTYHALEEAREAGYNRHTACYRQASYGEHPKGRACDMAAFSDGFVNEDAYGGNKQYGDNLAGWFVANANALGVMYVIWYRQIWQPGSGWSSYNGGGSPSGDHTNHVHVSIQ
ncbi:MAG: coiled-coil domain-containing protein [Micromonosporaceae bacterium]